MKKPSRTRQAGAPELKGVVKKMTGRLTNDPALEEEGEEEMSGQRKAGGPREKTPAQWNPDPHRRG